MITKPKKKCDHMKMQFNVFFLSSSFHSVVFHSRWLE